MWFSFSDHRWCARTLRGMLMVPCLAGLLAATASAAPIIDYQTTDLGLNGSGNTVIQFSYTITGLDLLTNQELDIQFDPTVFTQLSNGVAGPGFNLLLFQPNQPIGVQGDYSALATQDHPPLTGPFIVDATLAAGITSPPSGQPFIIYDDNVFPSTVLFQGTATAATSTSPVPEPVSLLLSAGGLLMLGAAGIARRRRGYVLDGK